MRHLENTGLFILSGFFFLFFRKLDYFFVCAFLLCLCLCCTSYFAQSKRLHLVLCTAFIAAAFLIPGMFLFFPAVFYVLLLDQYHIPALSCSVLYFYGIWSDGERIPLFSFWGIFLFLLAFRLQNRTEAAECLEQRLMKLRDDSTEKNLLLEEKNRMLAEKQDYEIYAATLKERNRIAREIHDNVGHLLSRSILITGAAKALNASDALSPVLDNLDHSLNQAMTSIRSSVHDLHDESLNLKEAAESLTSDFTFCPVTLHYDMGFEVPREIKYCFISIVKEALSNVARHSNATGTDYHAGTPCTVSTLYRRQWHPDRKQPGNIAPKQRHRSFQYERPAQSPERKPADHNPKRGLPFYHNSKRTGVLSL